MMRLCAADYIPTGKTDARGYMDFVVENFERADWPRNRIKRRGKRRRRRTSLAQTIRQARKAGDHGPVRVELPDGTIVTSTVSHDTVEITEADAEQMWRDRIAKHAAN